MAAKAPLQNLTTALRDAFGERLSTAAGVREQHGRDESYHPACRARCGRVCRAPRKMSQGGRDLCALCVPDHPLWHGHVSGGPRCRVAWRCLYRRRTDEPGAGGQRRGPGLPGAGRRHPQAAQPAPARDRLVLSRSTRAPTPRSAAWRRRALRAPTPCATAPCARTCWG